LSPRSDKKNPLKINDLGIGSHGLSPLPDKIAAIWAEMPPALDFQQEKPT
jgi:hypothetical protein